MIRSGLVGSFGGYLAFGTRPDGGNPTERVRIDSAGNVGIGTTSPTNTLSVLGTGYVSGNLGVKVSGTTFVDLALGDNDTGFDWVSDGNFALYTNNVERMRFTGTGNVGIGTTSPQKLLEISGSSAPTLRITNALGNLDGNSDVSDIEFYNFDSSTGGTGVKARIRTLDDGVAVNGRDIAMAFYTADGTNLATERARISSTGNLGLGTTTPTAQLSTTGTVRFAGLGSAGANLVTDALGNVTASSDERLKDKQGDFTRGLTAVNAISPVLYKWRPETGFDTQSTYAGFFAQNVQAAIPEAVSPDSHGYLTLADRPILAALVNATKEIGTITGAFKSSLIAWLGSASNGIGDLFARDIYATNGTFNRVTAQALCAEDICVTRDQLAAVLAIIGQTSGSPSANAPAGAPQPPIIELNGNASSTIEVGNTYNDLGARIVAPEEDTNLDIVTVLDGATTTAVSIDTSTPGEHTIIYTVTSPTTGLTSSALRTVTVQPATDFGMTSPLQDESQPPADVQPINDNPAPAEDANPFNEPPANDNASSTTAVDAAA